LITYFHEIIKSGKASVHCITGFTPSCHEQLGNSVESGNRDHIYERLREKNKDLKFIILDSREGPDRICR